MEKRLATNPLTKYYHQDYPIQSQTEPGLQANLEPIPDAGETSYHGSGQLKGKRHW